MALSTLVSEASLRIIGNLYPLRQQRLIPISDSAPSLVVAPLNVRAKKLPSVFPARRLAGVSSLKEQLRAAREAAISRERSLSPVVDANPKEDAATEEAPTVNPYRPDSDLGDLSIRFDPDKCRFATDEEVAAFNSRVVVIHEDEQHEYVMHGGSSELYVMADLRDHPHSFENGSDIPSPQTNPYLSTSLPLGRDSFTPAVSVARPGGSIFDAYFDVPMDLVGLLQFVLEHGECNAKRDGMELTNGGLQHRRITIGTCGRGCEKEEVNGHKKPKDTYGLGIFDKIEDPKKRESIVGTVAVILDAMQDAHDCIKMQKLKMPRPSNDSWREDRFAVPFRNAIGAHRSRFEDLTIQVKCISQHERVITHKDDRNCTKDGYTDTVGFCTTFRDALAELWSMKCVCNSRARAGQWQDSVFGLNDIMTRIRGQLQLVDQFFQDLALTQSANGGHSYHEGLTAKTHRNLVLDDSCPWMTENVGREGKYAFFAPRMRVPALPVRDFHLCAPTTIGFHMQTRLGDERKTVELLLMASYMAGYSRFYHFSMQHLDDIVYSSERPSLVYYKLAMKRFGKAFGESQIGRVKRMSPSNIDYRAVYLDDHGNVTSKMDDVIDGVLDILKWIDETVGTDDFHHANIEERIQACRAKVCNRSICSFLVSVD
jgi:hypothetical protein